MKQMRLALFAVLTVLMTLMSVTAFAARQTENPFKHNYVKDAQMLRKTGTAILVYQFMTRDRVPLPGVTMVYNTTKARDLTAVADANGIVRFDVKGSELFYIRQVIYNGQTFPVTGENMINNVDKTDVRKGLVLWNCIVKYGDAAFMSYRGN